MTAASRRLLLGGLALLCATPRAFGAALDVTTAYRLRALTYRNWHVTDPRQDRSFMTQNARLGFGVRNIELTGGAGPEPATMDVALALRAVGIAGNTGAITPPFDVIAARYPNATFQPFVENAYLRTHGLWGWPMDLTVGQQTYSVGSGLLLSDDGAGFAGLSARGALPWWDMKVDGYVFQPRNQQTAASGLTTLPAANQQGGASLMVFGATLEIPSEGTWQFNQLFERESRQQLVAGLPVNRVLRSFTSARYQISFGPLFFEGEAALQKGSANPTGPTPAANHITFNGNAQVMRAKWKQPFFKQEGVARLTAARGSGDKPDTLTTDEGFFPSFGHRYDGLERSGFGDFFAATPYDAFGGQSTATASGLPTGASGVVAVGLGFTPPAYRGITFDIDYWLFQADRNVGPHRTLGTEFDFRARYGFRDRFNIILSAARFTAGPALSATKPSSARYMLEFSGRF